MKPEIALNGLLLDRPLSGTATYTRNLVEMLPQVAPDLRFLLYVRNPATPVEDADIRRLTTPFAILDRGKGLGARLDKLAWEVVAWPLAASLRRDAVLHSLYFAAPFVSPAPFVVTVHDLAPLVLPGYHRGRQSAVYAAVMAAAVKRANAIITVSEHSKRDIVRILGIPESRVSVTYEAADRRLSPGPADASVMAKYGLPERYLLYLGGAERRKNVETLVRAWAPIASLTRRRSTKLVLVADFPSPDLLYPDVPGLIRDLGLSDEVVIVRRVDEEDKPGVYRSALAFCFASEYEGFGLTPLEALACGVPTLAANATSIPEVVGDAAILLPPHDVAAWSDAMTSVIEDRVDLTDLRRSALLQASRFCWEQTARQTASVYRQVLDR